LIITPALDNHTPYEPKTAALANLYGSGDSCSSYGNRNFAQAMETGTFGGISSTGFIHPTESIFAVTIRDHSALLPQYAPGFFRSFSHPPFTHTKKADRLWIPHE
jgi:hypothetical protein